MSKVIPIPLITLPFVFWWTAAKTDYSLEFVPLELEVSIFVGTQENVTYLVVCD
jgi:hypothetical protein